MPANFFPWMVCGYDGGASAAKALGTIKIQTLCARTGSVTQPSQLESVLDDSNIDKTIGFREMHSDLQIVGESATGQFCHDTVVKQLRLLKIPTWICACAMLISYAATSDAGSDQVKHRAIARAHSKRQKRFYWDSSCYYHQGF